jgi:hypothetical protein
MTNTPEAFKERVAAMKARREAQGKTFCAECNEALHLGDVGLCSLCAADAALITLRKVGA